MLIMDKLTNLSRVFRKIGIVFINRSRFCFFLKKSGSSVHSLAKSERGTKQKTKIFSQILKIFSQHFLVAYKEICFLGSSGPGVGASTQW